jgi:hypothetical protein
VAERDIERVEVDGMELHVDPVDEEGRPDHDVHTALPPRVESWRRRSLTGAVLTGFAFGLREALEPERDEPAIIVQVSGEPVGDLPVEAHLDELQPAESTVTIRPWLLGEPAKEVAGEATEPTPEDEAPSPGRGAGGEGSTGSAPTR